MRARFATATAVVLLAGCGSGSPPDEATSRSQIEQTVLDVHRYEREGNGEAACGLFTEDTREKTVESDRKVRADKPAESCEEAIEKQAYVYSLGSAGEIMRNVVVDAVQIDGERATATTHTSAHQNGVLVQIPPTTFQFRWEDGRWRM